AIRNDDHMRSVRELAIERREDYVIHTPRSLFVCAHRRARGQRRDGGPQRVAHRGHLRLDDLLRGKHHHHDALAAYHPGKGSLVTKEVFDECRVSVDYLTLNAGGVERLG